MDHRCSCRSERLAWRRRNRGAFLQSDEVDQEKKLSLQLQAVLPPRTSLKDACAGFKDLNDCVAALHVSHNLTIKFNCLKWDVTGAKPAGDAKSCAAPSNDKAMNLSKAIRELKPAANSRTEARTAEKRAREDIKDAS